MNPLSPSFPDMNKTPATSSTVLVTGAGTGLGAALAQRLAADGYAVAVHYRTSRAGAAKVVAAIRRAGGRAQAFPGKIDTQRGAQTLVRQVVKWSGGGLDAVVNNSGAYVGREVDQLTEADWLAGFQSTASAALFTTQAALPYLRRSVRPGGGRIVCIGDSSCDRPTARDLALGYHIGKTGLLMLARSIAQAEAKHGITCNLVSPGYLENSVGLPPRRSLPAGRYGTFDDVWNAVAFLLRPESAYLNGSNLVVSGGWNLR